VCIRVSDDGPGLDAAEIAAVTRRGVRLDESASGHGLGLAIVCDIVEAYGGRLAMANADPGLIVTIALPSSQAKPGK
jgi:signal transduction histidine kinase